ncbi:hypothetical protein EIP86_001641 [Pleurotus ostreatoroseus]|nr:hypothetical protein EIP86_001641 [Pleurotus ostreatoroseus]
MRVAQHRQSPDIRASLAAEWDVFALAALALHNDVGRETAGRVFLRRVIALLRTIADRPGQLALAMQRCQTVLGDQTLLPLIWPDVSLPERVLVFHSVPLHYGDFSKYLIDTLHAQPAASTLRSVADCLRSATVACDEYSVLMIRETTVVVTKSRSDTPYQNVPWKYSTHLMNIMTPGTLVIPYPWLTMSNKGKLINHADSALVEMWSDMGWSLSPTISLPPDPATGCLRHGMCSRGVRVIGDCDSLVFRFDNPGSVFSLVPPSVGWILGGRGCGGAGCPEVVARTVFNPGARVPRLSEAELEDYE